MTSSPRRVLAFALAVSGAVTLAACGGGSAKKSLSSLPSSLPTTTSSTPSPSTSSSVAPAVNPFTGTGPVPTTPTISVKIDDTEGGRPQLGIDKADIVFIEAVEGGLTRLAAIYGSNKPTVGYVRSTRPSDPDLLLQFGKITAAYSGGAHDSLPLIHQSGIRSWSNDDGANYYLRRSHPNDHGYINLTLNLAKVAKHTNTPKAKSIGWTFSPSLTGVTATAGTDIRTWVSGSLSDHTAGTAVEFRWDTSLSRYVRYIGGQRQVAADGKPVTATNVIVQFCTVVAHRQDTDVNGNPSQFTYTAGPGEQGSGKVAVFRDGKMIVGTWSRPSTSSGTTLKTTTGAPIPLQPGNSWVVLTTKGTPLKA
jgi:hypothetical protein